MGSGKGERCRISGIFIQHWFRMVQPLWKTVCQFLTNYNPKEVKDSPTKHLNPMFIVNLFTISKNLETTPTTFSWWMGKQTEQWNTLPRCTRPREEPSCVLPHDSQTQRAPAWASPSTGHSGKAEPRSHVSWRRCLYDNHFCPNSFSTEECLNSEYTC